MANSYDAILLIAFGGPTCPEEIRPFLARVAQGISIPDQRLEEVAHHYDAVGGKSPLNEITFRQADALQKLLKDFGDHSPVYVGMRNSSPFFKETLKRMAADGIKHALGFILSAHKTDASWERYQKNIADARAELGSASPQIDYCEGWHEHPLFLQTWAEQIQAALKRIEPDRRANTLVIFTAHSLPRGMAATSPYVEEVESTARLIAEKLHRPRWTLAYQSRSGRPSDPWLEPDIGQAIRDCAARGERQILVAPIGFVCDHVEVLYDLDIEAKKLADELGVTLIRASCPNDYPTFIRMIAQVVESKLKAAECQG